MDSTIGNLIALGLVVLLAIACVAMDYLDYRAEVRFDREHHVR